MEYTDYTAVLTVDSENIISFTIADYILKESGYSIEDIITKVFE